MKHRLVLPLLLMIGLAFFLVTMALAQGSYELPRWTINNGGGASQGNSYTLHVTIGQPVAAQSQGGIYRVSGGFWDGGAGQIPELYRILMPITVRK